MDVSCRGLIQAIWSIQGNVLEALLDISCDEGTGAGNILRQVEGYLCPRVYRESEPQGHTVFVPDLLLKLIPVSHNLRLNSSKDGRYQEPNGISSHALTAVRYESPTKPTVVGD